MNVYTGQLLMSTEQMDDPNFTGALVYIAGHDANGALGFIINQVFERPLNALTEFSSSPAFPLYHGGPVDQEHLFFVHCRPDIIPGGEPIADGIYLGGRFAAAIEHINSGLLTRAGIKIFVGYCGWDADELEAEIAEGCWKLQHPDRKMIFR